MIPRCARLAAVCLALIPVPLFLANPILAAPIPATSARPDDKAGAPTTSQLEALTGEYTNPTEPDTPLSFYIVDGKLMVESERRVPTEMKPVSPTEFSTATDKFNLQFKLDGSGQGVSVAWTCLLYTSGRSCRCKCPRQSSWPSRQSRVRSSQCSLSAPAPRPSRSCRPSRSRPSSRRGQSRHPNRR